MRKKPVSEIMISPIESVPVESTVTEVARTLRDLNIGALMVQEDEDYVGIISERDFVYKIAAEELDLHNTHVENVMTRDVTYAHQDDSIQKCYELMHENGFRHLPIVNDREDLVGMVSIRTISNNRVQEIEFLNSQLENYIRGQKQ